MRKIAIIFLLIFTTSVALSTVLSFAQSEELCLLASDTEKNKENSKDDLKKENEKYSFFTHNIDFTGPKGSLFDPAPVHSYASPVPESNTPPPDFC